MRTHRLMAIIIHSASPSTMATLPEITDLLARLVSHLKCLKQGSEEGDEVSHLNLTISTLHKSLNLTDDDSRVSVLDASLSLMCYKAPQVFDSMIEYLVMTIVTVLSTSIMCKMFRCENKENLLVGSSISRGDCRELIEMCNGVLKKLDGHGRLKMVLFDAVVRVAASTCSYNFLSPGMSILDLKSIDRTILDLSKLHFRLHTESSLESQVIPLRLLFWYLDPLILKHDVSNILHYTTGRPFLCLHKEFQEMMEWHNIAICLVLSPVMFIETRALLHNWFLMTGLACILELLVALVSVIMDIMSRPTWWGIPLELASKLPFSSAYFPHKNHLLRVLGGSFSYKSFACLVRATSTSELLHNASEQSDPRYKLAASNAGIVGHKSIWALAINFPEWFSFASALLFSEKGLGEEFQSKCKLDASNNRELHNVEPLSVAAARYIAWIVSPLSKSNQDLLVQFLTKTAEAWVLKQYRSGPQDNETAGYRKKLKKLKFHDKKHDFTLTKKYDSKIIGIWLKEFHNIFMQLTDRVSSDSVPHGEVNPPDGLQHDSLIRRIPLGILISCPNLITNDGCQLLLHYAVTYKMLHLNDTENAGLTHVKLNSVDQSDLVRQIDTYSRREAIGGVQLVFSLTDTVESIYGSFHETEESGLECINHVKVKASKYLIMCIKRLIQLNKDEDTALVLKDLPSRLLHWRHQGQEVSSINKDLDDVVSLLNHKLSLL